MPSLYQFECSRCGYRVQVTGGTARGAWMTVQTVHCHDCRALYDVVARIKSNYLPTASIRALGDLTGRRLADGRFAAAGTSLSPPRFPKILDRLRADIPVGGRWLKFSAACPVSPRHRISEWRVPGKCPRCAAFLDAGASAYRVWE